MDTLEFVQSLLNSDNIITAGLILAGLGLYRLMSRQIWPDIVEWMKERNKIKLQEIQTERELEQARIETGRQSDRLMAEKLEGLSQSFTTLTGEIRSSIGVQRTIVNLIASILTKLNGGKIDTDTCS